MTEYIVTELFDGDELLRLRADFAQAACPIEACVRGAWFATPFQVADAGHSHLRAAELVNRWLDSEGGAAWDSTTLIEVAEAGE